MFIRYQYLVVKLHDQAQWLSWLERRPVTAEVTGSSPVWVVEVCRAFRIDFVDSAPRADRVPPQAVPPIYIGSVVKRLRHRPFTAVTRVRFPSESVILYLDL